MRRIRAAASGRDDGAYAVLYALVLLIFVALTALVVDLGALQHDRRSDRVLTDNAAISGATAMGDQPPDAYTGCLAAWTAIRDNLGVADAPAKDKNTCSVFPKTTSAVFDACPATAITATGTLLANGTTYTISVTWPVLDNSSLMLNPDIRPQPAGFQQPINPDQDGPPCKRLGVTVGQSRQFLFASALGDGGASTVDHSVALNSLSGGNGTEPAPLVILDPHACDTLVAQGGGGVLVSANNNLDPPVPGIIAIDSDGISCSGGQTVVNSTSQSGNVCTPATFETDNCQSAIWAEDSSDGQQAQIDMYALRSGSALPAYNVNQVTCTTSAPPNGPSGPLCPKPLALSERINRDFVDEDYNCTTVDDTCDPLGPTAPVSQLQKFVQTSFGTTGSCLNDGFPPGFKCIGPKRTCSWDTSVSPPTKNCTTTASDQCKNAPTGSFAGNVFIDCVGKNETFTVSGLTAFTGASGGATVVFNGNVDISGSGACLAFNTGGMCSATLSSLASDGPVVFVAGNLTTSGGGAAFIAPQTFVMLGSCARDGSSCDNSNAPYLNLQGNSSADIVWSAPLGPLLATPVDCVPGTGGTAPTAACFHKLALWNEYASSNTPDTVSGQAGLLLRGSFFTPNAQFNLSGGGNANIQDAQFITGLLDVNGGGLLTMVPNTKFTISPPLLSASLIR